MRFVFTFVREKVKFVREKSVKCQGISRGPVCGNHDILLVRNARFACMHLYIHTYIIIHDLYTYIYLNPSSVSRRRSETICYYRVVKSEW